MRHSTERILVSHAGNLPRPPEMQKLLDTKDFATYNTKLAFGAKWIVDRQIELGVDIVNDGEYVKAGSYTGYMNERVTGFATRPTTPDEKPKRAGVGGRDAIDFPGTRASGLWNAGSGGPIRPGFATPGQPTGFGQTGQTRICNGPVKYTGQEKIKQDIANLKAALFGKSVDGYVAALGPLSFGAGPTNEYYKSEDEYMSAVADAVREEYKAVTDAGLIVQIDEPQFATDWQFYPDYDLAQWRKHEERSVEIINHALRGLPEDQIRFHVCWGSGHRPHVHDAELGTFADILVKIKAQAYSYEAANVRHAHEWKAWKDVKLPDGKILMPGVLSHATDLVEHPEQIAERIVNLASVVGKENIHTGTDCGIGSRVGHEEIVWAKLKAMSEGAKLASKALWGRVAVPA